MQNRIPKLLFIFILVLAVAVSSVAAAPVTQQQAAPIYLRAGVFTPARGESLAIPAGLSLADYASGQAGYYLLQFRGPVEQSWKDEMAALGAELLGYIPDFAFKVRMTPAQAAQARGSSNVAWVGVFQPGYKLDPSLLAIRATQAYVVRVERGANATVVAGLIAGSGAEVLGQEGDTLLAAASPKQLLAMAKVLEVASVEAFVLNEKHGPAFNEYGAGNIIGANVANSRGYDGSTQIAAVADTGLGGGTAATAHADVPASRITNIYNWPGVSDSCWTPSDDGAVDVDSGHGTHTALSVVSDGGPGGEGKSAAPAANLVFQAVENWATMKGICAILYPNGYYLTGLNNLSGLYQQAYDAGARVHSNSWGADSNGQYNANSVTTDTFMWNNPALLITFSAGNSGKDTNNDGVVDNDSIGAPATAKNVLTVGASEGDRQGNWQCDLGLTYTSHDAYQPGQTCSGMGGQNILGTAGQRWGFTTEPLFSDVSGGNANQIAPFSSRGPTDDTRIKPDVVAPGTWVLSGYSDLYQEGYDAGTNPRNGAFQSDGWGMPRNATYKYFGGTSMANPIAAGGAVVVRDFYQKAYSLNPSAALVKATLINSATDLLDENNDGVNDNDYPIPNNHEGWGLVNLDNATDNTAQFVDAATGLGTSGSVSYQYTVNAGAPLKVTVVWTDYPSTTSASVNLVNDLDLTVTAPGGTVYKGNVFSGGWSAAGGSADRRNNVENVYLQAPAAGTYTVTITGFNVPQSTQKYALVVDGSFGSGGPTATPTATFTSSPTPTPTNTPTPTATFTSSPTPTPTATATATPVSSNTGLLSPSANAAQTSSAGDNNGYQTSPANAHANDGLFAVDTNSGTGSSTSCTANSKDKHHFYNYNVSLPGGAVIDGIEVRLDARVDSTSGSPKICVQLSWDGGTTWTTAKSTATLTTSEATYTLGTPTDTWGRAWSVADFSNTNFRLRVIDVSSSTSRDFSLDWVAVRVTYH